MADGSPSAVSVGSQVRVDNKYAGFCRFKGSVQGRKGVWLGLEMDDTVGDNDGSLDGVSYFKTHDGQGMFIREEAGRVDVIGTTNVAEIPEEMLEHMKFLFSAFDTDNSGGIDQNELYTAMKMLGQRASKNHVKNIFQGIDIDGSGQIDFHEFIEVMQVQWKGMDLSKVVKHIKDEQERERRKESGGKEVAAAMAPEVGDLVATLGPLRLNLKYFGAGTNLFLFLVYTVVAILALVYQWLILREDVFNVLLVGSFATMSSLFAVGGYVISQHKWAGIKLYALLMLLGAGAQFALCMGWFVGAFDVSALATNSAMERSCGLCLADDKTTCASEEEASVGSDMPWFCCCYQHQCVGENTIGRSPTTIASCSDGCTLANLTGTDSDAKQKCIAMAKNDAHCDYYGNADAGKRNCTTAGTKYDANQCGKNLRSGKATCNKQGTCRYTAAIYDTSKPQVNLNTRQTEAKATCESKSSFQSHQPTFAKKGTSKLGDATCFVHREADSADEIPQHSFQKCMHEWQVNNQISYVIIILVMFPIQLLAAYVGWVMPDLYVQSRQASQEDSASDDAAAENPVHEDQAT